MGFAENCLFNSGVHSTHVNGSA